MEPGESQHLFHIILPALGFLQCLASFFIRNLLFCPCEELQQSRRRGCSGAGRAGTGLVVPVVFVPAQGWSERGSDLLLEE